MSFPMMSDNNITGGNHLKQMLVELRKFVLNFISVHLVKASKERSENTKIWRFCAEGGTKIVV